METITNIIAVVAALRWLLAALAFVVLGMLYADAHHAARQRAARIVDLERDLALERRRVAIFRAHVRKQRHRAPLIAGRVVS